MKAIIDTCVVIDFLLDRKPFCNTARKVFEICVMEKCRGYITAKSVADIYYIAHRHTHSDIEARRILQKILSLVNIIDATAEDIIYALQSNIKDYEDAILDASSMRTNVDCIVTRNIKDYKKSSREVYTPKQFISKLSQ